jgi:hypothetical protein
VFNHDMTGYIAAPASKPGVVYVSLGTQGLYRLTGADRGTSVGNGITATTVGSFTGAGAVSAGPDGSVWLAQVVPYGTGLWKSTDGTTWAAVNDGVYLNMADFPTGVAVTSANGVMVATKGDGVVVSR